MDIGALRDWLLRVPPDEGVALARARFAATLLLAFLPLVMVLGMIVVPWVLSPLDPMRAATLDAASFLTVAVVGAFALNRTGRTDAASWTLLLAGLVAVIWASTDGPVLLTAMSVMFVISSALFPGRAVAAYGLLALASSAGFHGATGTELRLVVVPTVINTAVLAMTAVVNAHRGHLARLQTEQLRARERWLTTTLGSIGDAVLTVDEGDRITYLNPVGETLTGWTLDDARGRPATDVFRLEARPSAAATAAARPTRQALESGAIVTLEEDTDLVARDGDRRHVATSAAPIIDDREHILGAVLVCRDMTDSDILKARAQSAQRLEALGQLAGGVAHDFNNLLTAIAGSAEVALDEIPPGHAAREELSTVLAAAERASNVTGQLLAFSRRQVMRPEPVRLDAVIERGRRILERLMDAPVRIEAESNGDPSVVTVDQSQLDQVVLNLAVNARDAMPEGGTLTLTTDTVEVREGHGGSVPPGRYGRLRVSDTGGGMSDDVRRRAFEPFFSTKGSLGTGLGLSTVYGIVEQSGGTVRIDSQEGEGTTVEVYLPSASEPEAPPPARVRRRSERPAGAPGILLAEDNAMVRSLATRILTSAGYRVVATESGVEAVAEMERGVRFDMLITDVIMPGLGGRDLAARFSERFPEAPVLFMSGYGDEVVAREGIDEERGSFLGKPFSPGDLRDTVAAMLLPDREGAD